MIVITLICITGVRIYCQEENILLQKNLTPKKRKEIAMQILHNLAVDEKNNPLIEAFAWIILNKAKETKDVINKIPLEKKKGKVWESLLKNLFTSALNDKAFLEIAEKVYSEEISKNKNKSWVMGNCGIIHYYLGRKDQAFDNLKKAVILGDRRNLTIKTLFDLSVQFDMDGFINKCIQGFEVLYKAFPSQTWVQISFVTALRRGSKYKEAEKILKHSKGSPKVFNELGLLYKAMQMYDKAEKFFKKAGIRYYDSAINLGCLYIKKNKIKASKKILFPIILKTIKEGKPLGRFSSFLWVRTEFCSKNHVF